MGSESSRPDPAIAALIEDLLAASTGPDIQAALSARLGDAQVRLYDAAADVFYAVDGAAPDLPAAAVRSNPGATQHLCRHRGEVVALLESAHAHAAWAALGLGPAIVAMQAQDLALNRLRTAEDKVRVIADAGNLLREFDVERVLVRCLQAVLGVVGAEIGALLAEEQGQLQLRVAWGLDGEHLARLRLRDGSWLPDAVLAGGTVLIWDKASLQQELSPEAGANVHLAGLLALPLVAAERRLGVVLAVNAAAAFSERDRDMVATMAQLAAIALDNARLVSAGLERERLASTLDIARRVQEGIYPKATLSWEGFTVAGRALPCDETGGDYYQHHVVDGRLAVVIGDVSGHGLGAALYTTMAHAALFQALRSGAGPGAVFRSISTGLAESAVDDAYMTAALGIIDPATRIMRWSSAGHPPALLLSADGHLRRIETSGLPLGTFPDVEYDEDAIALASGDTLLLYTDGVSECWDSADNLYGDDRLEASFRRHAALEPEAMVAAILADVRAFAGTRRAVDDHTLLVLRA